MVVYDHLVLGACITLFIKRTNVLGNIVLSCCNLQWPHFTYIHHYLYSCSRREYTVDKSVLSSELCFSSSIWAMLPQVLSNFYSAVTSHCLCCPIAPAFLYFILYFVALVVLSSENALTLFVWLRSRDWLARKQGNAYDCDHMSVVEILFIRRLIPIIQWKL